MKNIKTKIEEIVKEIQDCRLVTESEGSLMLHRESHIDQLTALVEEAVETERKRVVRRIRDFISEKDIIVGSPMDELQLYAVTHRNNVREIIVSWIDHESTLTSSRRRGE